MMVRRTVIGLALCAGVLACVGVLSVATLEQPSGQDSVSSSSVATESTTQVSSTVRTGPQDHKPPVLLALPHFSLTDQLAQTFGTDELLGKAWIANFISTRDGLHSAQTEQLLKIQTELGKTSVWHDVRLVSFTVDPEHDTSEVMREYAQLTGADEQHWRFLTGMRESLWQLCEEGFQLPIEESDDSQTPTTHSTKLALVDPQGHIRGYYDGESASQRSELKRDLQITLQERMLLDEPPWMEIRQQMQLATAEGVKTRHDVSFVDRVKQSGIDFRHRVVDDAGRSFVTAHYDHGNGIAIADVDGDARHDIYFVLQLGGSQLWRNLGKGKFENITEQAGIAVPDRIE